MYVVPVHQNNNLDSRWIYYYIRSPFEHILCVLIPDLSRDVQSLLSIMHKTGSWAAKISPRMHQNSPFWGQNLRRSTRLATSALHLTIPTRNRSRAPGRLGCKTLTSTQ